MDRLIYRTERRKLLLNLSRLRGQRSHSFAYSRLLVNRIRAQRRELAQLRLAHGRAAAFRSAA
jgi:hypothetical protein